MAVPNTESDVNPRDRFRAAFDSAVATHAAGGEPAADDADDDDDDEDAGDEDAGDEADSDDEPEADAEGGDGEEEAPATREPETSADTLKTKKAATDSGLVTDEEFTALQTKHKDDPVALRRALEKAFTQKTQRLSEARRSTERLQTYAPLIDALEANPEATIRRLAKLNGVELTAKAAEPKDGKTTKADAVEDVIGEFKTALGPELEYLGDALAPAISKMVERLMDSTVTTKVEPLRSATQRVLDRQANETTDAIMASFEKAHPDWKDHEDAILALATKLDPRGMTEAEFLETCYKVVTRDSWDADREKNIEREVSGRFKKRTAKLDTAEAGDKPRAAVPESQVKKRPTGRVSFRQAAKDALAGVQYDEDDDDE